MRVPDATDALLHLHRMIVTYDGNELGLQSIQLRAKALFIRLKGSVQKDDLVPCLSQQGSCAQRIERWIRLSQLRFALVQRQVIRMTDKNSTHENA
jgi:hypothetical protein